MRYRKHDAIGDYRFGNNVNDFYINNVEAVAQAIDTRLQLWLGEWFADMSQGTGWSQAILGKRSKNLYELTLRQRVLETPGVLSIEKFHSELNEITRKLKISMIVNTKYGQGKITGGYDS